MAVGLGLDREAIPHQEAQTSHQGNTAVVYLKQNQNLEHMSTVVFTLPWCTHRVQSTRHSYK